MQEITPQEFLEQVKQAYQDAMKPTIPGEGVFRHRVRSTSGVQEDLVAYFIRSQADELQVHIDQPITIRPPQGASKVLGLDGKERAAPKKTWYPDIVVVRRHAPGETDESDGTIVALVDVKTDLGWHREDESFRRVCEGLHSIRVGLLEGRHRPLPTAAPRRQRRQRAGSKSAHASNFDSDRLLCAEGMTCHVVVVTAANSGDISETESQRQAIARRMNVHLHVLMQLHPNRSKQQIAGAVDGKKGELATADDLLRGSLRLDDFASLKTILLGAATRHGQLRDQSDI